MEIYLIDIILILITILQTVALLINLKMINNFLNNQKIINKMLENEREIDNCIFIKIDKLEKSKRRGKKYESKSKNIF